MDELIARQIKDREAQEVVELVLDNARSSVVTGLSDKFCKLSRLSIVNAGLVSLKEFPSLPSLKELQLSDNKISGGLESLSGCPHLCHLSLAGNRIQELEDLKPLKALPLTSLDLYNCPITNTENYRSRVFELLTSLQCLDGLNEKGEELESDGEGENGEEEEEEEDDDDEEEPGLDYLLNNDLRSDSEEEDYDPDADEVSGEDEATDEDDSGAGPSSSKRPKLDESEQKDTASSDTD